MRCGEWTRQTRAVGTPRSLFSGLVLAQLLAAHADAQAPGAPAAEPSPVSTVGILVDAEGPIAVELGAAARGACVAHGLRLVAADEMRAALHFTAPSGAPTVEQIQALATEMQLEGVLMLAADDAEAAGTLLLEARFVRPDAVTVRFGEVARTGLAEWVASIVLELRAGDPPRHPSAPAAPAAPTSVTAVVPGPPGAPAPSAPSGEVALAASSEPGSDASHSFVLRNHGRSTVCELSLVTDTARTPLLRDGQIIEPGSEVRLQVAPGEHRWEAVTCRGYRVRSGVEDLSARSDPLTLQFHDSSLYPFWISAGIAAHMSYVPGSPNLSLGGRVEVNAGYSFGAGPLGIGLSGSFGAGCETALWTCGAEGHLLAGLSVGHAVAGVGARFFADGTPYFALGFSGDYLLLTNNGSGPWQFWYSYVVTFGSTSGQFFGLIDVSAGLGYGF